MTWDGMLYVNTVFFLTMLGWSIFAPYALFRLGWWIGQEAQAENKVVGTTTSAPASPGIHADVREYE
jgi:hypothetical protein